MSSWEQSAVADTGVSPAQMHFLEIIGKRGRMRMNELAELLDLHLWRPSESQKAALITVGNADPGIRPELKQELSSTLGLDHITIEIT